jgi:hypothetical protein
MSSALNPFVLSLPHLSATSILNYVHASDRETMLALAEPLTRVLLYNAGP